jgi:UDP-N-acetyl-D-mannosaminuronate dehydrogenase
MANPPSLDKIMIGIVGLGYVALPLAVYLIYDLKDVLPAPASHARI